MKRDFENKERNAWLGFLQVLIEQFGEKKFSAKKANLFREEFSYLSDAQINSVLDNLVGNFKYAPTLDEIKYLTRPYRAENASRSVCDICSNTGFVSLYKKTTGENIAFKCKCDNAPRGINIRGFWEIDKTKYTRLASNKIDFSGKSDCFENYKSETHKVNVEKFIKEFGNLTH